MNFDLKDYRILVVEDTLDYKQMISEAFGRSDKHTYVSTLKDAHKNLSLKEFDCIILDLSLPDGNGLSLLNQYKHFQCPIIILTSTSEVGTKVMGLSMGAQDYIVKPFDALELIARVQNKITHTQSQKNSDIKIIGNMTVDILKRKVVFQENNPSPDITRREFDCLIEFVNNIDIVLSREALLDKAWGNENFVLERSVDATIASLRKKVKDWNYRIRSVYGVGYKLEKDSNSNSFINDPKIFNIFISESKTQLDELDSYRLEKKWHEAALIVHKLKGTFALYTSELDEIATKIELDFKNKKSISSRIKEFIEIAQNTRTKILQSKKSAA